VFAFPQAKNQKVDLSLVNMLQYPGVRLTNTDKRMRIADLTRILRHDRFDCSVIIRLNTRKVFWVSDIA
jgi:hypothetical protein